MPGIRMKHPVGKQVRVVESRCESGVRHEVHTQDNHTVIIDEPAERGGTVLEVAHMGDCQGWQKMI